MLELYKRICFTIVRGLTIYSPLLYPFITPTIPLSGDIVGICICVCVFLRFLTNYHGDILGYDGTYKQQYLMYHGEIGDMIFAIFDYQVLECNILYAVKLLTRPAPGPTFIIYLFYGFKLFPSMEAKRQVVLGSSVSREGNNALTN